MEGRLGMLLSRGGRTAGRQGWVVSGVGDRGDTGTDGERRMLALVWWSGEGVPGPRRSDAQHARVRSIRARWGLARAAASSNSTSSQDSDKCETPGVYHDCLISSRPQCLTHPPAPLPRRSHGSLCPPRPLMGCCPGLYRSHQQVFLATHDRMQSQTPEAMLPVGRGTLDAPR